jgi:ubiquinone/menaquinone biosynthesis C-methylase UbiE
VNRCHPTSVVGIDPSAEQLTFARARLSVPSVDFRLGDAMALAFADDDFDVAVMPLVIFFVPVPATGVTEMVRVVRPGGMVAAYAWHMEGGGFPYYALQREMHSMGVNLPTPPSPESSQLDVLRNLWIEAGLEEVETREFVVQRTFADFEDYWTTVLMGPSVGPTLAAMAAADVAPLRDRMRADLPTDATGRITYSAMANAVQGRVPTRE